MSMVADFEGCVYSESSTKTEEKDIFIRVHSDTLIIKITALDSEIDEYAVFLDINYKAIQKLKSLVTYMEAVYIKGDDE